MKNVLLESTGRFARSNASGLVLALSSQQRPFLLSTRCLFSQKLLLLHSCNLSSYFSFDDIDVDPDHRLFDCHCDRLLVTQALTIAAAIFKGRLNPEDVTRRIVVNIPILLRLLLPPVQLNRRAEVQV